MKIETIEKAVTTARVQAEVLTKKAQEAGQAARLTKNQAHQAKGKLKQAKQESKRARKAAKVAKRAFAKATSAADKAVAQLSRLEKKIQRLRKKAQKSPRHDVTALTTTPLRLAQRRLCPNPPPTAHSPVRVWFWSPSAASCAASKSDQPFSISKPARLNARRVFVLDFSTSKSS